MRLIIINGPCGVGKSTAAKGLHALLPLSFLIDSDAIRRSISGYTEQREESYRLEHTLTQAMVDAYLKTGHDVITERMQSDENILGALVDTARRNKAEVTEIILWAGKDFVLQRAQTRGFKPEGLLTPETCERFWHEIDSLKSKRPQATIVNVEGLTPDQVVDRLRKIVGT